MAKPKVLILSTANAARSQMAEGFLKQYAGDRLDVFSTGLEPGEVHPFARQVMDEIGIDIGAQQAKGVDNYLGQIHFGYMITVCSDAEQNCPSAFMGISHRHFWDLENPTRFAGNDEERLERFRQVRDQIQSRVREWLDHEGFNS